MLDEEIPMREQIATLLLEPFFLARRRLRGLRARTPFGHFGLLGRETLPLAGHSTEYRFDHIGHDMKLANLMRHPIKDLGERLGRERRAIGGDT